jgi:hypothetical protein
MSGNQALRLPDQSKKVGSLSSWERARERVFMEGIQGEGIL